MPHYSHVIAVIGTRGPTFRQVHRHDSNDHANQQDEYVPMSLTSNNALVAASQWLADVATGSIAVGAATIAVAAIGFAMLAGRIDLRRGANVILGCFILFAAPSIANSFVQWANGSGVSPQAAMSAPLPPVPAPPPNRVNDPYAGASLIR